MLLTGKWSGYNTWNNYMAWDPNSINQEGTWAYVPETDQLTASSSQDAFSGAVNSQYLPWDDYAFETVISVAPGTCDSAVGLAFRWQDENNFYFFLMDGGQIGWSNYLTLGMVQDGVLNYLSVNPLQSFQWTAGTPIAIRVMVIDDNITVTVNGSPVFSVTDSTFGHGAFGPLTISQPGASFSNFQAYLLPIQAFQPGIGDGRDCLVMPPVEQDEPVNFQYSVCPSWQETQKLSVYPEHDFSYMLWSTGYETVANLSYDCSLHAYPQATVNAVLTATGSYQATFNYTLGCNIENIVNTNGEVDIIFVVDGSYNMQGVQSLSAQMANLVSNLSARSINAQFGVVGFYNMPEIQVESIPPTKEIVNYGDAIDVNQMAYPGAQVWQVANGSNGTGWTTTLSQLQSMVSSIVPLTQSTGSGQPAYTAINFALSTYSFRPHVRQYVIVISNSQVSDYSSATATSIATALEGGNTPVRGMVMGVLNTGDTVGYITASSEPGVITLTGGADVSIASASWSTVWNALAGMAYASVTEPFTCTNLSLMANSVANEVSLTNSVTAHTLLSPYFPANTLNTDQGYTVSTTYLGANISVAPSGTGDPMGWADARATSYSGSWNLNYSVYEYEALKPVAKASSFLPVNASGRIFPGTNAVYTLNKTSGLANIQWKNAGQVTNSTQADTIAISTTLVYSSTDLTGSIDNNDTESFAMPAFYDASHNPMPSYPTVTYILTDTSRNAVHFKWASGTQDTSVALQLSTTNPSDSIIIEAPASGSSTVTSPSWTGYASVNGLLPLIADGDGILNTTAGIPLSLQNPSGVSSVQYVIGWISDSTVQGIFQGTGTRFTSFADDIIVFSCGTPTTETLTNPAYGDQIIASGIIQPDQIFASLAYDIDLDTETLIVNSLTPGVEVWATGNTVYARDQGSTIFGEWCPFIHSGYFTFGNKKYYLFAEPQQDLLPVDINLSSQFQPLPQQGAPVIVYDQNGQELRCVCFQDSTGRMTLYNTEYFTGLTVSTLYLLFDDIENITVTLNGFQVGYALTGNALQLPLPLMPKDNLVVNYCLANSFMLQPFAEMGRPQNQIIDLVSFDAEQLASNSIFEGAYLAPQYL